MITVLACLGGVGYVVCLLVMATWLLEERQSSWLAWIALLIGPLVLLVLAAREAVSELRFHVRTLRAPSPRHGTREDGPA